ncbi:MAG: glycosyltransferase family 1 protein [Desulfobacterales bacterium]|nr:MAG: glycosyltransferase family 1 protein [Desulfobacterales bacterium]
MPIAKVIFCGKSKKKTGNTRFMLKALRRRVAQARFINLPRYKKLFFWTDYQKIIQRKIIRCTPDLVLIYSKDIPYAVLQEISAQYKTAIFYPDVKIPLDENLIQYARLTDYLFITNKRQLPELQSRGVKNPIFCMQGCDRDEHRITPTRNRKWVSEVAFIGRPSTAYRLQLLQRIHQRFHLKAWGARWQEWGFACPKTHVYPQEYAKICYATPIILGCDYSHEMDYNFSNRTWITLGCGGFLLTNYQRGLEEIFIKGVHLEWYHSQEECLDLIDYYLKHEGRRKEIARHGYQFAHAHRTYDVVVDEIISRIENDR